MLLDLLAQERRACLDFVGLGVAVSGRAALDHVGNVDLLAPEPRAAEKRVELLSRRAHERLALQVLVAAGALPDEHHASARVAHAKDEVGARHAERAALAVAHEVPNLLERHLARSLVVVAWRSA